MYGYGVEWIVVVGGDDVEILEGELVFWVGCVIEYL